LGSEQRTKHCLVAHKGDRTELRELRESELEGLNYLGWPKISPHRVDRDPSWNSSR
jgi:hypothetical protein